MSGTPAAAVPIEVEKSAGFAPGDGDEHRLYRPPYAETNTRSFQMPGQAGHLSG
ncbi:MAG TPA: hypothetical protein VKD65_16720 [Candidatus Angelobacter sp.]|nr:hypothetical protein [Candidatus Angelobacter sp.]